MRVLGLAQDGVGWAFDEHNAALVDDEMKSRLDTLRQDIVDGKLEVHDYMSDGDCPD